MASAFILVLLPLLSFLILLIFGSRFGISAISVVGVIGIALSASFAFFLFAQSFYFPAERQLLWTMLADNAFGFSPIECSFYVDSLALTMSMMVASISFLIAVYSTEYMARQEGYCRFFATMNLFVAFMLMLVLADNLWVLFIGWEGVSVCSYLLIGFYYRERGAEHAAMKAFITTKIGDMFFIFGMFGCALTFNSLNLQEIVNVATNNYPHGSLAITIITLCLLLGAVGKSAQLPLQIWLPDAMWGPTPVSALIHAATMVTAGVYLIARLSELFALSITAQTATLAIGGITLLLAGFCALLQTDLKRVLAYSTMSQIGYMFLALGVNAPRAAIFHLITHACYKALLFLSAGVVGHEIHHYDLSKMGGLSRKLPLVCVLFLLGCGSLMGWPFITAGFFSKEWIMSESFASGGLFGFAYVCALLGVFLTGIYTTRMLILAFFSPAITDVANNTGARMITPLIVLAFFSTFIGWLNVPIRLFPFEVFSRYLSSSLPERVSIRHEPLWILLLPSLVSSFGIVVAILKYGKVTGYQEKLARGSSFIWRSLQMAFGFDWLYTVILIKPYTYGAKQLRGDPAAAGLSSLAYGLYRLFGVIEALHTQKLSHYVPFFVVAAITMASVMVLL